jgi:hypothetical protein
MPNDIPNKGANNKKNGASHDAEKRNKWPIAPWLSRVFCYPDNIPLHLTWIFTAFLALFAYNAWDEATHGTVALQGQLRTMQEDQRPWVGAPEITPHVDGNGIVTFTHVFRNVGRSPALGLFIYSALISETSKEWETLDPCEIAKKRVSPDKNGRVTRFNFIPSTEWRLESHDMPDLNKMAISLSSL